jgi:hypothetical protein
MESAIHMLIGKEAATLDRSCMPLCELRHAKFGLASQSPKKRQPM